VLVLVVVPVKLWFKDQQLINVHHRVIQILWLSSPKSVSVFASSMPVSQK